MNNEATKFMIPNIDAINDLFHESSLSDFLRGELWGDEHLDVDGDIVTVSVKNIKNLAKVINHLTLQVKCMGL